MTDEEITLPPMPHRALRPGAGDDAMTDYARAAVLLDRQQRDKPAPSAEPVVTDAMVEAAHSYVRSELRGVSLPDEYMRGILRAALERKR